LRARDAVVRQLSSSTRRQRTALVRASAAPKISSLTAQSLDPLTDIAVFKTDVW
jgi:hypothetical protein